MPNKIVIVKRECRLRVLDGSNHVVREYDVAVGERADGKARVYEEDFRTPEGRLRVEHALELALHDDVGSTKSRGPNRSYYPFYLAHKFGNPFEDLGYSAYGTRLIALSYPRQEDRERYQELLLSGEIQRDWKEFMEEKWRAIFEHISETSGVLFEKVKLMHEKRRGIERSFLEGKTFQELYDLIPSPPRSPVAVHGTNDPDCIGHKITGGCVRMHNQDIEDLIEKFVTEGMVVEIEN